jgi:glucokinase
MTHSFLIGIDIGGTKIYGGIVTPAGEIIATRKVPTPSRASTRLIINTVKKTIKELLEKGNIPRKAVIGIGIAVPGIVDNNGKVIVTPNIDLSGVPLQKILEKKFNVKVAVGNDANLGLLGEKWIGAGRKVQNIVGIFPGTGIGGGIIVDGHFITGKDGAAAELGHISVDTNGPHCTCGNQGCLEAFAGRWAIERDIRAEVKKRRKTVLTRLAGKDLKQIKSGALAEALKKRDAVTTKVLTKAAQMLAKSCISLNHVFNPDMFLFGGGLIEACGDFLLPIIENALKNDPFFAKLASPKIARAKLNDDAVMLGAIALIRQKLNLKDDFSAYYPRIAPLAGKKAQGKMVSIKGKKYSTPFFIRADGKIKEPDEPLCPALSERLAEEICKKSPDVFFIASGRGRRINFSPKALRFLKKRRILPRRLPLSQAIQAYNTSEDRRAILFCI